MNKINFININQSLNLEQEFDNGHIKLTDSSSNEYIGYSKVESKILVKAMT